MIFFHPLRQDKPKLIEKGSLFAIKQFTALSKISDLRLCFYNAHYRYFKWRHQRQKKSQVHILLLLHYLTKKLRFSE